MDDIQVGDQYYFNNQKARLFTVQEVGPSHVILTEPTPTGLCSYRIGKSFVKVYNMIHVRSNALPYSHRS
jgi:hypothetical protein